MAKKKFEQQLEALDQLRQASPEDAAEGLRKALANRSNYAVAKAARIAGERTMTGLIPDLLAALDRFFEDPAKTDPQCWAKNAIVQALADLGYSESAVFLRGLRHVQMEAVWGGQTDTAGPLRARCALALVACRDLSDTQLLSHLIEVLADTDKTVRAEAARAIGRIDRAEAALLLRLRALMGDEEPEVLGACFSALLSIEGRAGIGFVKRFLDRDNVAGEAALALGLTHEAEAFELLRDRQERTRDPDLASVLLTAIALTNLPEAIDYLIGMLESKAPRAKMAREALKSARMSEEQRGRLGRTGP
jgi:HEAT repeat protein